MTQANLITRLRPVALALALVISSAHGQGVTQPSIVVADFDLLGNAPTAVAETIRGDLAAALDRDPCIEAQVQRVDTPRSSDYVLRGTVYDEGARAFVALQLINATTSERLWFENYDYRGISGAMMAEDILRYLKATPVAADSRIRSCSGP